MASSESRSTEVREFDAVVEYDPRSQVLFVKLDLADADRGIEVVGLALQQKGSHVPQRETWFEQPSSS